MKSSIVAAAMIVIPATVLALRLDPHTLNMLVVVIVMGAFSLLIGCAAYLAGEKAERGRWQNSHWNAPRQSLTVNGNMTVNNDNRRIDYPARPALSDGQERGVTVYQRR